MDGGGHVIALGTVIAARASDGQPLNHHARVFWTRTALEEPSPP
jgi:hypothetical protein